MEVGLITTYVNGEQMVVYRGRGLLAPITRLTSVVVLFLMVPVISYSAKLMMLQFLTLIYNQLKSSKSLMACLH
jgi:hypothetical protein